MGKMESLNNFSSSAKRIISSCFFEDGNLSLTRVLAFTGYLVFIIGSFYLMYENKHWEDYSVFASYTGGGGLALQFGNKFVNSKYNSIIGSTEPINIDKILGDKKENIKEAVENTRDAVVNAAKESVKTEALKMAGNLSDTFKEKK
jgi:hypothetical protein